MKKLLFISTLFLWLSTTTGCYKDLDNTPEPVVVVERPDVKINTTLHGIVSNTDGDLADQYTVEVNGESFISNQDFYFMDLILANKKNQHISILKEGKELAFANVSLIENDVNKVNIKAFPEWKISSLTESENLISLNSSLDLVITNPAILEVEYGLIEDSETINQLGFWGTDQEENDYFLQTNTAFYFNSTSQTSGENNLTINYNFENITTSVDLAIFHLNENFHQWILVENISTTTGSLTLPQFGYYILANISNTTFTEGQLSYEELPISFQNLELTLPESKSISIKSSANGRWSSFLPTESLGILSIKNPCGLNVYEEEIVIEPDSPIHTKLNQQNIEHIIPIDFVNIDCNEGMVPQPGVVINYGSKEETMIFPNEQVDVVVLSCGELTLAGYDVIANEKGAVIPWSNDIEDDLGSLCSCPDFIDGYSYIMINGEHELLPGFTVDQVDGKTIFKSVDNKIRIIIKGEGVGEYETEAVNFFIDDPNFGKDGYRMFCENSAIGCGFDDCIISHFENIGNGLNRISFSGTLWMQTIDNPTAGNYFVEGQIVSIL